MKSLFLIVAWCLLFVLCWPLALLEAILFLPARLLGGGGPAPSRR